jgi:hypothetical protein
MRVGRDRRPLPRQVLPASRDQQQRQPRQATEAGGHLVACRPGVGELLDHRQPGARAVVAIAHRDAVLQRLADGCQRRQPALDLVAASQPPRCQEADQQQA